MCPLYYEDVTKTIWKCRKKKIQGFLLNFDSLPWRCPESFLFYSNQTGIQSALCEVF